MSEPTKEALEESVTLADAFGMDCGGVFDPHPDDTGLTNNVANGVFVSLMPWLTVSGAALAQPPEGSK
jgi:hypothetical protein